MSISLRAVTPDDMEFLYRVYSSTRQEELAPLQWTEAQLTAFLTMQFNAQHTYYQAEFPDANYQIVLWEGQPAGRLYLHRQERVLHIIDIALLPEFRNRGIGSRLLNDIIQQGNAENVPVSIYVEAFNPAQRLYQRLGFRKSKEEGLYFYMERAQGEIPRADPEH
jgi:ribosomal protein S18 acetylase RimI-like enzyme